MSGRSERAQKKELDELRKLGVAPPEEDEDGFYVNPHIPKYMSQAPWYVSNGVGLKHQRFQPKKDVGFNYVEQTGVRQTGKKRRRRWVKGACENCGAATHKKRDCTERPRKKKAKCTNDISLDEFVPGNKKRGWDAKRDQWSRYDLAEHDFTMQKHRMVEQRRKEQREIAMKAKEKKRFERNVKKEKKKQNRDSDSNSDSDSDSDSDLEGDNADEDFTTSGKVIQRFDSKTRITVRNLRIREDTAKYLINLDPKSAKIDPKSRSMRGNPYENSNIEPKDNYRGDNATNQSGDAQRVTFLHNFTAKTETVHGVDKAGHMNLTCNPTIVEQTFKDFKTKEAKMKSSSNKKLLSKYGGAEHMKAIDKSLLIGQNEKYVEYLPDGRVIEPEVLLTKSKYVEDEHPNGHRTIFGSFYDLKTQQWGYVCCHSAQYHGYCTAIGKQDIKKPEAVTGKIKKKRVVGAASMPLSMLADRKTLSSGYVAIKGVVATTKVPHDKLLEMQK